MENPFLIRKYPDLPGSIPVEAAVKKARSKGTRVRDNIERTEAYLDRIEQITEDERGYDKLKHLVLKRFTLDTADPKSMQRIAESLYESEKRIAIEQGRGAEIERLGSRDEIVERYLPLIREKADIQRKTLAVWLDYLQENDAKQPTWFRYFVVRSMGKMGVLDKEHATYSKRTGTTVAPFPELNSEALGWVYKRLDKGYEQEDVKDDAKRHTIEILIKSRDFSRLYAYAQIETAGMLNRESLEGEWRLYPRGSDFRKLEADLKGKGTGWCTAEGSAKGQLANGDFHVYFTRGKSGYTEPRIAIRMENGHVAEVRGVNPRQNVEPELVEVAQARYHDLPGGDTYDKKASDMIRMTALMQKQKSGDPFTRDDLRFLYELDAPIEGFGYDQDSRVDDLRHMRIRREDMAVICGCTMEDLESKEQFVLKDPWDDDVLKKARESFKEIDAAYESEDKRNVILRREDLHRYFKIPESELERYWQTITYAKDETDLHNEYVAKIFDLRDVIDKAEKRSHRPINTISTREIWDVLDEAGYRPATLEELETFCLEHWKPEEDRRHELTEVERYLKNFDAESVLALGSLGLSDARGAFIPSARYWNRKDNETVEAENQLDEGRYLNCAEVHWYGRGTKVLAILKSSPRRPLSEEFLESLPSRPSPRAW